MQILKASVIAESVPFRKEQVWGTLSRNRIQRALIYLLIQNIFLDKVQDFIPFIRYSYTDFYTKSSSLTTKYKFYTILLILQQMTLHLQYTKLYYTMMQQDQFFDPTIKSQYQDKFSQIQLSDKSITAGKETDIDYDNFHFQAYFDRCTDLTDHNQQKHTSAIIRKLSREVTNEPVTTHQYNHILREGFLERQIESLIAKNEKRYCVLTSKQLFCFQDQSKQNLLSCINICLLPCSVSQQYELIKIYYCVKNKSIVLKAKTIQTAVQWYQQIKKVIDSHLKTKKIYLKKNNSSIYSEKNLLSQQEFLSEAQTGDILVMKTKQNSSCSLQRLVTNSEYDHVSLIVRLQNNQIQIFESNANQGVVLYGWKEYHCRYNFYQRIAYRKLIYQARNKLQDNLLNFVKSTLGKEYDIGAIKLIRQWSSQDKSKRSYFCSQLIAKAYKMMGLVQKQKASARYWPVDFTQRGGLQLLDGAALGRQKTIVLSHHISKYE